MMNMHKAFLALPAIVICVFAAAASADWELMNPWTTTEDLHDIWGASDSDVFFAGTSGVILHWDGTVCSPMESGTQQKLLCLWGFSAADVFAGGEGGVILRWDGTSWSPLESAAEGDIASLWGAAPDDMWAAVDAEDAGYVLHWDGIEWCEAYVEHGAHGMHDVWGLGPDEVYVAGDNGTVLRWDGTEWADFFDLGQVPLYGVWASASDDIHAVGSLDPGRLYHWDGQSWEETACIDQMSTRFICGVSADEVYCGGGGGDHAYVLRWNGDHWSWDAMTCARTMYNLGRIAGGRVLGVGECGYVTDRIAGMWTPICTVTGWNLNGVWADSENDAFAVGSFGTIVHYDGQRWSPMDGGVTDHLQGVWGTNGDNVFAVGNEGVILRYDGSGWGIMESPTQSALYSIHGTGPDLAFAVGGGPYPRVTVILRWDGESWQQVPFEHEGVLIDVFMRTSTDAVASGSPGQIARWDGTEWTLESTPTERSLWGVWSYSPEFTVTVGNGHTALSWDGHTWTTMSFPSPWYLGDVWGRDPDDVFAVGGQINFNQEILMHWDGLAWNPLASGDGPYISRIWPCGARDFFAVGYQGSIHCWHDEYPLGVRISVPIEVREGDRFGVRMYLDNPGPSFENIAVFLALGFKGQYWFWPGWQLYDPASGDGLAFQIMKVPGGTTRLDVLPEFILPSMGAYTINDINFYGVMMDAGTGEVVGNIDVKSVSYIPNY